MSLYTCPKCDHKDYDAGFSAKQLSAGSGYNHEFGMVEYWWELELTCPECGKKFDIADSSL